MKQFIISLLLMTSTANFELIEIGTIENIRADKMCLVNKDKLIVASYQNIHVFSDKKVVKNYQLKGYSPDKIYWNENTIYSGNIVINTETDLKIELDFQAVSFEFKNPELDDLNFYNYELKQTTWSDDFSNITVLFNYRSPRNTIVEEEAIPKSIIMKLDRDKNNELELVWLKEYLGIVPKFYQFNTEYYLIKGNIEQISNEGISTEIGRKEWNIRNLARSEDNTIIAYSNKNRLYKIVLDNLEFKAFDEKIPDIIFNEKYKNQYHLVSDKQNQLHILDTFNLDFQELTNLKDKILSISFNSKFIAIGFLAPIPYVKIFALESN